MYNLNPLESLPEKIILNTATPEGAKVKMPDENNFEFVRFGESAIIAFKHKNVLKDVQILVDHYNKHGYTNWLPHLENFEFKRTVAKFRATLDAWELIPIAKVFCKDELYMRCLTEGPSFTEYIKKCRSTTLCSIVSITEVELDPQYICEGYEGYDSIFHERNLIHWDDRDSIDDVKYAFMPCTGRIDNFQEIAESFLKTLKIDPLDFNLNMDTLGELKNTKMYDPATRKTALMREFWTDLSQLDQPYFAKRSVVLTEPGSTRDAGTGDPSTIAKVKCINKLCRTILERCGHSASAPADLSLKRLMRVLERNTYLHLDFKKYGLAFSRALQNIMLQVIGHLYSIDVEDLIITDFFIEIDGNVYKTCRGLMLGWVDCLNELCVHALLWDLSYRKNLRFDWIAFNDDVEISFYSQETNVEKAEMIRLAVLTCFNIYDIIISISKTYASRASVFLEKYFRFKPKYGLDMQKRQLSCKAYARSLTTSEPWMAKVHFATARLVWPCEELASRCILTCPIEFTKKERVSSLFVGGWYPCPSSQIDTSLENQPQELVNLSSEFKRIKLPDLSSKPVAVSTEKQIIRAKEQIVQRSKDASEGRDFFDMREISYDINFEAEGVLEVRHIWLAQYSGHKGDTFAEDWNSALIAFRDQAQVFDPGG